MKKVFIIILTVVMLTSNLTFISYARSDTLPFVDINETAWYYDKVTWAYQNNIIFGINETEFCPQDMLTREQAAMIFYNWSHSNENFDSYSFTDVKVGAWYCDAVEWAYRYGLMFGIGDDKFGVGQYITRQDFITVIYRAYLKDSTREYGWLDTNFYNFRDHNKTSNYALEPMKFATGLVQCILTNGMGGYEQPFVYGDNNNMLRPKDPCLRVEAVTIISNTNRIFLITQ